MMKKRAVSVGRKWMPVLIAALLFVFFSAAAEETTLLPGRMPVVELSDEAQEFSFTPEANSLYGVYLLPVTEPDAHAELKLNGEILAQGDGRLRLFSARLIAGTTYTLSLSGSGTARLDVARETLSRSFEQPLELENSYAKMIARPGDVHWYALSADAREAALIAAAPDQPELTLETMLFGADGRLISESDGLPSGAAALSALLHEEETYLLRVCAPDGSTGRYRLEVQRSKDTSPVQEVRLSEEYLLLEGWTEAPLGAAPEQMVFFDSSQPEVAARLPDGTVKSRSPGETVITAYAYGGAADECTVTVSHVPVESVSIAVETSTMAVGDTQRLTVTLTPENATDRRLTFVTDDENVVSVAADGTLTATGEGTARIVAITGEGSRTDMEYVAVEPAGRRYRALLIGEQNYASTVDKVRPGSIRSVESLASLLGESDADGEKFRITTLMDAPRDEVIAGIRTAFDGAAKQDLSLIYITCHGFYRAGMTFFVMADGSVLSASDLARELSAIPGEIVLLADCCGSGGLIGESSSTDDLLDGVTKVFQGIVGETPMSSRIRVIASARLDQDSYRISFSDEEGMATVFARALCDAAGWDIDRDAPGPMSADADYNGDITFDELGRYMHRRVQWYLSLTGGYVQNVRYFPEGCETVIISNN